MAKRNAKRGGTVVLSPSLREKLADWVDGQSSLNELALEIDCTVKWFWLLRHGSGPINKHFVLKICEKAGIPFGPDVSKENDFLWIPAEEEHVKWAASVTPAIYQEAVSLDTKLNWRKWHDKGYWAIIHQGLVCGICECLSVKADVMEKLCCGEIAESELLERANFEQPPWPTQHLLIQHLMILDRSSECIEPSPLAFNSVLANMPFIIERCVGSYHSIATIYASPMHSREQNRNHPSISERLMRKLGFTEVESKTRPPYPFFSVKADALVERLKQLRETIRRQ